jgi:hypothetical protein
VTRRISVPARTSLGAVLVGAAVLGSAGCSSIGDPDAAAGAFIEAVTVSGRSLHVDAEGRARLVGPEVGFRAQYDVVGSEVLGSSSIDAGEMGLVQNLALVEGHTVTGFREGSWSLDERTYATPDPFAGLARDDVVLVGTDRRGDQDVVHLRLDQPVAAAGALATYGNPGLSTIRVDAFSYDLFVTADGVPLSADVSVTGSIGGELSGPIEGHVALRFSRWGELARLDLPFKVASFPAGTTFVADNASDDALIFVDLGGVKLLVAPCSRVASAVFDGTAFSVLRAVDGQAVMSLESTAGRPTRYGYLDNVTSMHGPDLPYVRPLDPPCPGWKF